MNGLKKFLTIATASLVLLASSPNSRAENDSRSLIVKTGYFFPLTEFYGQNPINYSYYRTDLSLERKFRKKEDIQASLDISLINVDKGFGSFYAGPGFSLAWKFFEYKRFSAGLKFGWSVFYNDAYKEKIYNEREQKYVGSPIEFDSRLGLSFEAYCTKNYRGIIESYIEHISNAGLSKENEGINTLGFMAGIRKAF